MKNLIIVLAFVGLGFAGSINPFGINFKKDITMDKVIERFAIPDTTYIMWEETMVFDYQNFTCFLALKEGSETPILNCIKVIGEVGDLKIGMSKRKILKSFGKPTTTDNFPTWEMFEYQYRNQYTVTLKIKNKKLSEILIHI